MVEAGPILAAAFLRADLVDEAALFRAPHHHRAGWHRRPRRTAAFRLNSITAAASPSAARQSGRIRSRRSSGREMFTGIVTDIGEVVAVEPRARGLARLKIACGYDPDTIDIGASIACSGVCLTVVARGRDGDRGWFAVDAAAETLRVTTVGELAAGHPHQSRTRTQGRRRARRPYRRRPCRRPRRRDGARGPDRHGAACACVRRRSLPASSRRRARWHSTGCR